jgi:hypothetical protein
MFKELKIIKLSPVLSVPKGEIEFSLPLPSGEGWGEGN